MNTFKRDYVARMDLRDVKTVLAQLSAAFPDGHPNSPAYGHLKLPHLN